MAPIEGDKLRGHLAGLILASLEAGAAHGWEIWTRLEAAGDGTAAQGGIALPGPVPFGARRAGRGPLGGGRCTRPAARAAAFIG